MSLAKTRFVLVIPALSCLEEPIILSCHPDYLKLIEKVNHMENIDIKQNSNKGFVCSICRRRGLDVKSGYSASFSRTGVNKIFTTTTINYASKIEKAVSTEHTQFVMVVIRNLEQGSSY